MKTVRTIEGCREQLQLWRLRGLTIAFVPTMGNLHAGHMRLVETAQKQADKVVVSIFVNPTQFGPGEDYERYPRTEQQDQQQLSAIGADLLFLPGVTEIYPQDLFVSVQVVRLADHYCGRSRPGHFAGVATVVCKLFNIVQADYAFFGEKDFQQLAVIRRMVSDLNLPIQIFGVPTVREVDGLAMSSRNGYLSAQQREIAPQLYRTLCSIKDAIQSGKTDFASLSASGMETLRDVGFLPEYLAVCNASDLSEATADVEDLVILVAAKLGTTRLIDNISFTRI